MHCPYLFCIFCMLSYVKYAEYDKGIFCILFCILFLHITAYFPTHSAYFPACFCILFSKSAFICKRWWDLSIFLVWVGAFMRSQQSSKWNPGLRPSSGTHAYAQSSKSTSSWSSILEHQGDSIGWDHSSGTSALLSRPARCNPSFQSHSEILRSSLQHVVDLDFVMIDGPRFVWHLLLWQHVMSLLLVGERQEPERWSM